MPTVLRIGGLRVVIYPTDLAPLVFMSSAQTAKPYSS